MDTPFIDIVQSGTWRGFTELTRFCLISMIVLSLFLSLFVESYSLHFRLHTMLSQTIRVCARDWVFGKNGGVEVVETTFVKMLMWCTSCMTHWWGVQRHVCRFIVSSFAFRMRYLTLNFLRNLLCRTVARRFIWKHQAQRRVWSKLSF